MRNKYNVFCLKKVYLILTHAKWLEGFEKFVKSLNSENIGCEALLAEEEYPLQQDALYITDSREVLNNLTKQGLAVAVYLQEENKGKDLSSAKYAFEEPDCLDVVYAERVYRRYKDIPWDILETKRCYLRETVEEDVDAFFEIYSEPEMTRYTEKLYESKISEKAYVREYRDKVYKYFEFGIWTVIWKETGEVIGRAGLNVREGYDMPELGYVIGLPWQGKSVAGEVCKAVLEYAYKEFGFERVMTLIQKENIASVKVAEKLGFQLAETVIMNGTKHMLLIWEDKSGADTLCEEEREA